MFFSRNDGVSYEVEITALQFTRVDVVILKPYEYLHILFMSITTFNVLLHLADEVHFSPFSDIFSISVPLLLPTFTFQVREQNYIVLNNGRLISYRSFPVVILLSETISPLTICFIIELLPKPTVPTSARLRLAYSIFMFVSSSKKHLELLPDIFLHKLSHETFGFHFHG